jgi:cytochrome c oxidase cbb3-type subunit 1
VVSAFLYLAEFCPRYSRVLDFTWYGVGVTQWQLLGFAGVMLCGAIYYILPLMMARELPFPGLARAGSFFLGGGVLLYVLPLVIGGVLQGLKLEAGAIFADVNARTLMFFRISTSGQALVLLGSLPLLLNLFVMTLQWKLGLVKALLAAIKAPLETPAARRDTEVTP